MAGDHEKIVQQLLRVKAECGQTYSGIATGTGLTNLHVAALLKRQAALPSSIAYQFRLSLPALSDKMVEEMENQNYRMASLDRDLLQEPTIYRIHEAIMHFGESIKDIIYEDMYDGYLSALDDCCSVGKVRGVDEKDRVVLTIDGRFRPYTENVEFSLLNYPRQPKRYSRLEEKKRTTVNQLLYMKKQSGRTYNEIAQLVGYTNVYVAQLFRRQAQLKPEKVDAFRRAVHLSDELVEEMMKPPMRFYDPNLYVDPFVYQLYNSVMHMGESIKEIINEDFGDGIMSTVDFYCSVQKDKGDKGLYLFKIIFDGKFLPHTEQEVNSGDKFP